jgi:hypothetical protein
MKDCVQCFNPVDMEALCFEQRLINDEAWCRKCFDEIMTDVDLNYLDSLRLTALAKLTLGKRL